MARRRPTEPTVNPARGAALVVVAVVVGLLLLRNGLDTSEVITASKGEHAQEPRPADGGNDGSTTTTVPPRSPAEVTVIVLNGTSVGGAAGKYSTAIGTVGYQMLEAGDAASQDPGHPGVLRARLSSARRSPWPLAAGRPGDAHPRRASHAAAR